MSKQLIDKRHMRFVDADGNKANIAVWVKSSWSPRFMKTCRVRLYLTDQQTRRPWITTRVSKTLGKVTVPPPVLTTYFHEQLLTKPKVDVFAAHLYDNKDEIDRLTTEGFGLTGHEITVHKVLADGRKEWRIDSRFERVA